jgi:predicted nucleic acid-binding protein
LIVVDASALLELLLRTNKAPQLEALLLTADEQLHAPHLIDVEVVQALRRLVLAKSLTRQRAELALEDLSHLVIERHAHPDLVQRAWQFRSAITIYDGVYVALAEALEAPLVTCDVKLARAHGHDATITQV